MQRPPEMPDRTQQPRSNRATLTAGILNFGRMLYLLPLALSPWLYGSVSWRAQLILVVATAILLPLAVLVALLKKQSIHPLKLLLLAFPAIGVLQLAPLPGFLWESIAPRSNFEKKVSETAQELHLLQTPDAKRLVDATRLEESGSPILDRTRARTLSIHTTQTRASLAVLSAAIAYLFAGSVFFRDRHAYIWILGTLACTCVMHAGLGLYQQVAWNRWTLLDMPSPTYFGTFVSRNTAPQYYALGLGAIFGLAAWWMEKKNSRRQEKRYNVRYPAVNLLARIRRRAEELLTELDVFIIVCIVACMLVGVAVFATASRGGVVACLGAALATAIVIPGRRSVGTTFVTAIMLLAVAITILAVTLDLDEALFTRLGSASTELSDASNPRYEVWRLAISNPDYWLFGSGLGTFHFAILPAQDQWNNWTYHAESIYVETLSDMGLFALLALLAAITWIYRILLAKLPKRCRPMRLVVFFGLTAICLQSIVDFSLIIPALFLGLTAILGSFLGQIKHLEGRKATSSFSSILMPVALLVCMAQGIHPLIGFAEAEWIERIADTQEVEFRIAKANTHFPLSLLHIGRIEQSNSEFYAREQVAWPSDVRDSVEFLSRAENLAGAIRAPSNANLSDIKQRVLAAKELPEKLLDTEELFAAQIRECAHDWRASWGLLRSDCGQLDDQERSRNYARLALLTKHRPILQQRIGTYAIWSGDRKIGLVFWRHSLLTAPTLAPLIKHLLGNTLDNEELQFALSNNQLLLAQVAMEIPSENPELVKQVVDSIDMTQLLESAESVENWELVAWVASQRLDRTSQIAALRRVCALAPLDAESRFVLSQLLVEEEKYEEAAQWIKQAIRRTQRSFKYEEFLDSFKDKLAP